MYGIEIISMKISHILLLSLTSLFLSCTSGVKLKFEKFVVKDELNDVIYYIGYSDILNYEKFVFFIRGTGRVDASHDFGMGAEASLFGYSLVYPQKSYLDNEREYFIHDNRQQRMHDNKIVIEDLIKKGAKKILLLADSEGTMLAPEIAVEYSNYICGLVCMGGSVSTFEENLLYTVSNKKGIFTNTEDLGILTNKISEIYSDPDNVNKEFLGHSYKFWISYLKYNHSSDLKKLSCPILYINGENDDLDIMKQIIDIQKMQKNGINIEQIVYPGIGHQMKAEREKLSKDILDWAVRNKIID